MANRRTDERAWQTAEKYTKKRRDPRPDRLGGLVRLLRHLNLPSTDEHHDATIVTGTRHEVNNRPCRGLFY